MTLIQARIRWAVWSLAFEAWRGRLFRFLAFRWVDRVMEPRPDTVVVQGVPAPPARRPRAF